MAGTAAAKNQSPPLQMATHEPPKFHLHLFRRVNEKCFCNPTTSQPHTLYRCSESTGCRRTECQLERASIEGKPGGALIRCIPEEIITSPQDLSRWDKSARSCRLCSNVIWAWCATCHYRLCVDCLMSECERSDETIVRVRHISRDSGWIAEPRT